MPIDVEEAAAAAAEEVLDQGTQEESASPEQQAQPEQGTVTPEQQAAYWYEQAQIEKARRAETAAYAHQMSAAAQHAQALAQQFEQQRRYEAEQFQRARQLPAPRWDKPEELVDDPRKLSEALNQVGGYAIATTLSHIAPIQQELTAARQLNAALINVAARSAFGEARASLASSGFAPEDFDEIAPEVYQRLQHQPALIVDPQRVAQASLAVAYEKGKKLASGHAPETPMPSIGVGGGGNGGQGPRMSPMAKLVEKHLGRKLDPKRVAEYETAKGKRRVSNA